MSSKKETFESQIISDCKESLKYFDNFTPSSEEEYIAAVKAYTRLYSDKTNWKMYLNGPDHRDGKFSIFHPHTSSNGWDFAVELEELTERWIVKKNELARQSQHNE